MSTVLAIATISAAENSDFTLAVHTWIVVHIGHACHVVSAVHVTSSAHVGAPITSAHIAVGGASAVCAWISERQLLSEWHLRGEAHLAH